VISPLASLNTPLCPHCHTPWRNPSTPSGSLTGKELAHVKQGKPLNRICLACGEFFHILSAPYVTVPGLDPTAPLNVMPWDERGYQLTPPGSPNKNIRDHRIRHALRPYIKDLLEQGLAIQDIARHLKKPERRVREWVKQMRLRRQ
jgi:hypothetical protein